MSAILYVLYLTQSTQSLFIMRATAYLLTENPFIKFQWYEIWILSAPPPIFHSHFLSRQRFISPEKAHKINIEFAFGLAIFSSSRRFWGG